jgi:hypothetical protein
LSAATRSAALRDFPAAEEDRFHARQLYRLLELRQEFRFDFAKKRSLSFPEDRVFSGHFQHPSEGTKQDFAVSQTRFYRLLEFRFPLVFNVLGGGLIAVP